MNHKSLRVQSRTLNPKVAPMQNQSPKIETTSVKNPELSDLNSEVRNNILKCIAANKDELSTVSLLSKLIDKIDSCSDAKPCLHVGICHRCSTSYSKNVSQILLDYLKSDDECSVYKFRIKLKKPEFPLESQLTILKAHIEKVTALAKKQRVEGYNTHIILGSAYLLRVSANPDRQKSPFFIKGVVISKRGLAGNKLSIASMLSKSYDSINVKASISEPYKIQLTLKRVDQENLKAVQKAVNSVYLPVIENYSDAFLKYLNQYKKSGSTRIVTGEFASKPIPK